MSSDPGSPSDGAARPAETGWDRFFAALSRVSLVAASIICTFLIVATTFSVVVYQRGITISWLDDLLRMLLIWLVFLGSVAPIWRRDHITMDALYMRLTPDSRRLVDMFVAVLGVVICSFLTWVSLSTLKREYEFNALLSSGEIPAWLQTLAIPVSFALMTVAYVGVLVAAFKRRPPPPAQGFS